MPAAGASCTSWARTSPRRLDIVPAQFRVIVTRRPKYACRRCQEVVAQAPVPAQLIEGGIPTEATVAHVLAASTPTTCRSTARQIYARQGVSLDRSTLADWVGKAAFLLRPVHARLFEQLKASGKLFADETTAPVLDPGRGRTKTGQLFAYARDDRPWGGSARPASPTSTRRIARLRSRSGISPASSEPCRSTAMPARALAERNAVSLAFCWRHVRRRSTIWRSPAQRRRDEALHPHRRAL
ncbi:MAG: transposase [Amaricoccus sp.]